MVSKDDRNAALVILGLAAAGLVVRLLAGGGAAPGAVLYNSLDADSVARDSLASRAARLGAPLVAGEKIDIDVASAADLTRLPRIGPALAGRIVAEREARGTFGSLEQLDRVAGIGPAVIEAVRPFAEFSGPASPLSTRSRPVRIRLNVATVEQLTTLPGIGQKRAQKIVEDRTANGRYRRIEDLARVRGIGDATVERLRPLVEVP